MPTPSPVLVYIPEELRGPRVLLRPYRPDDAPLFWEAVAESRDHLAPWLPWVNLYKSVDDAREFMIRARAWWMLRRDLIVGIFDLEGRRLLGGSGLHRMDWEIRAFEIGYWIRRTAQGRGYVTEAVQLLTRMAFETLEANRVEIRMDPRNEPSRRVPERLGFVLEGTLRACAPDSGGKPSDRHVYALTRDDYRRLDWSNSGG